MNLTELVQVYRLEEDLDDLVINAACEQAGKVNNSGVQGQIDFLQEAGWSLEEIRAALTDEDLPLEEEMKCHTTQR